ncbi:MAG: polysaccharide deacetylase family protein [Parcubacteria group bacterium]
MRLYKRFFVINFVFIFSLFLTLPAYSSDSTIPQVKIYNSTATALTANFLAYQESFTGGVYPAAGDLDGDGQGEIITGTGYGGGPQVRIFNSQGKWLGQDFFSYGEKFRGGTSVTTGDLDGDGQAEIITGSGPDGGPQVRVFNQAGQVLLQFFAYAADFRGGVNVAAGDIDGDGQDEIITGAGVGGGPHVRVFSGTGRDLGLNIFPYPTDFRGGVNVAAGDVDGDGSDEIVTGPASEAAARVKIYKTDIARTVLGEYVMYTESFQGGVNVATGDLDGDGQAEIITAPAFGGGPHVRAIRYTGQPVAVDFLAYAADFRGGVKVAAEDLDGDDRAEIITAPAPNTQRDQKCAKNCVALTFDDGYSSGGSFEQILEVLKKHDVKATFFLLGVVMQNNPAIVQRLVDEGHQLANHSYSHGAFTRMSAAQIRQEIIYTDDIAKSVIGETTKPYFRYPGGSHNTGTDAVVHSLGYRYYMWTASTGDTSPNRSATHSLWGALAGLHDGSIILAHTQSPYTAQALDQIITAIEKGGYNLVTIAQMPE